MLAVLRYLFPGQFETMLADDKPDLQDAMNSVGIEVTSAVEENDMKVDRLFSDLRQGKCENIEKIQSCGYTIFHSPGGKPTISATGTSDGEKATFQKILRKKVKKICQIGPNLRRLVWQYCYQTFQHPMRKTIF